MIDYNMTLIDRIKAQFWPIPFNNFSVKVGDWELFISDHPKYSLSPQVASGQAVAASLPPYQVFMVGKMGRNGKVYIDHKVLGHEMQHCLSKADERIADIHEKKLFDAHMKPTGRKGREG